MATTGLPYAPDLHYFRVEKRSDATVQRLWEDVKGTGELAVSRNNPDLDLNDATFVFYAVLRPNALNPNEPD